MTVTQHPSSLCESAHVGDGTAIGAFTRVRAGAVVGRNCRLGDHVVVDDDVVLGDRVTLHDGAHLSAGVHVADDVVVGPGATLVTQHFGLIRDDGGRLRTEVAAGAALGAGCTLLPGVKVGRRALVGAGAVVTKDVPPNAVVVGNPARISGYADRGTRAAAVSDGPVVLSDDQLPPSRVDGVALHRLTHVVDLRGSLVVAEFASDLPFVPRRAFLVFDVASKEARGEHAHRVCEQLLVCVRGGVSCVVDDGTTRQEYRLDRPDVGLHMPAMIWGTQYRYSPDAVLLVFASHAYDADDYIRDYDEFLAELGRA